MELMIATKGVKAKKKRLAAGGGGASWPNNNLGLMGESHIHANTQTGLTHSAVAFSVTDVNSGAPIHNAAGPITDVEVADYIHAKLRGGTVYSGAGGANLVNTLEIGHGGATVVGNNTQMLIELKAGLYNPNQIQIQGGTTFTVTFPVDVQNLVPSGQVQLTNNSNINGITANGIQYITEGTNLRIIMNLFGPINTGELIMEVTATATVGKSSTIVFDTANPANAAATIVNSCYIDIVAA